MKCAFCNPHYNWTAINPKNLCAEHYLVWFGDEYVPCKIEKVIR